MSIDVDDLSMEIGDAVRDLVHSMLENATYDLDDDERHEVEDAVWQQWKDWV